MDRRCQDSDFASGQRHATFVEPHRSHLAGCALRETVWCLTAMLFSIMHRHLTYRQESCRFIARDPPKVSDAFLSGGTPQPVLILNLTFETRAEYWVFTRKRRTVQADCMRAVH